MVGVFIVCWLGNKVGCGYNDKDWIVVGGLFSVEMGKFGRCGCGSFWSVCGKCGGGVGI